MRKRRSFNQVKEEISYRVLRQKLPEAWVIHEYGPDYGIDCVIELFDYIDEDKELAETLGENFYVQLKSSDCIEYTTRRAYARGNVALGTLNENRNEYVDIDIAKFSLDASDLMTVQAVGPAVPVLLILVDINSERAFFVCLNDYLEKVIIPEDPTFEGKGSKTIYIPVENEILPRENNLLALRAYGKRAKMYAAFTRFAYQRSEIQRSRGIANYVYKTTAAQDIDMLKTFVEASLRQDLWEGHDFWEPMGVSFQELEDVRNALAKGIHPDKHEHFKQYCDEHVWRRLCNLANMYEELVREWYLPTVLAQLTSYPKDVEIKKLA